MNILKSALFITLSFISIETFSQKVIQITSDTTFTSTLVFDEDTIIEGVGIVKITLEGSPKIKVNSCRVMFKNLLVTDLKNWGVINGPNSCLEWSGIGMHGMMANYSVNDQYMLDGTTER